MIQFRLYALDRFSYTKLKTQFPMQCYVYYISMVLPLICGISYLVKFYPSLICLSEPQLLAAFLKFTKSCESNENEIWFPHTDIGHILTKFQNIFLSTCKLLLQFEARRMATVTIEISWEYTNLLEFNIHLAIPPRHTEAVHLILSVVWRQQLQIYIYPINPTCGSMHIQHIPDSQGFPIPFLKTTHEFPGPLFSKCPWQSTLFPRSGN